MKTQLISVIALAMTTTAGIATAQNASDPELKPPAVESPICDDFIPMTRSERLRHYLGSTFGPKALARSALRAEFGQATKTPKEWGSGAGGLATRFGSAFAQHFTRNTLEYGASSLLHEDNRYVRSGKKRFWKRTGYAMASTFVTRHDNGRLGFAFSRVGSAGGASFISRLWMPHSIATVGAGASSFGITIGIDMGANVMREFWPDLKRHFRRN